MTEGSVVETTLESARELLRKDGNLFAKCESPSLRLEKFIRIGGNTKGEEVQAVVECQNRYGGKIPSCLPEKAISFTAKLEANLIVNQAGGILENAGLCLHPHFGSPYIPGSAVKGVARHAAWCAWEEERDAEKKLRIANEIAEIFGYPTNDDDLDRYLQEHGWKDKATSGTVCFLPAIPESRVKLVSDIVNCHHPKYYDGKMDVAYDNEAPNPQFFPAISEGRNFVFVLVPVRGRGEAHIETAMKWLLAALTTTGIGAKTAAGYGWFSYDAEAAKRAAEAAKRAEETAKRAAEAAKRAEEKAADRAKRDKMTDDEWCAEVLKRWKGKSVKQIIKSGDITKFDSQPENTKKGIVLALRQEFDLGHEVWQSLRSGQKGDIDKGAVAIRAYCKNVLRLGKMP